MKYKVPKIKGPMVTAQNEFGQNITRDASKMNKIKQYSDVSCIQRMIKKVKECVSRK